MSDVIAPYEDGYTLLIASVNVSQSLVNTQNGYVLLTGPVWWNISARTSKV